ncbi:MAG TPA: tyrosine-protein phosphatase [Acidimicrobiales bacterium]|nr:tyrosine-protein phosphatase [Acidimicrobiales bacterium]
MTTFAERLIRFDSCFNFRDLGGYETDDGRRVRWKTLYRADTLHRLDGPDLDLFLELGLRSVIDLRSQHELDDHGRFRHDSGLVVHHVPMIDVVGGPRRPVETAPDASPRSVGEGYISMADEGRRAIGSAVALLAGPDALPAVFHCTAGKDRTGILAAILLSAIGVRDEDIVDDYMLTGESRAARNAYLRVHEPDYYAFLANLPSTVREMHGDAIPTLLAWMRARHGSASAFLLTNGVGEDSLAALEANLLEP